MIVEIRKYFLDVFQIQPGILFLQVIYLFAGQWFYNLLFPNTEFLSIAEVMEKADVGTDLVPEILDIVELLVKYGVIEESQYDYGKLVSDRPTS